MTLLGIIGTSEILLIVFLIIINFLLPVLAIVDIIQRKFERRTQIAWVLTVFFLNVFGALVYFIFGRRKIKHVSILFF